MARPRSWATRRTSPSAMTPAAWSAITSPKLCPAAASARRPRRASTRQVARLAAASAGWAHSVAVRRASWARASASPNGGAGHHHLGEGVLGVDGHGDGCVPHGLRLGEGERQLAAHVQPLGALAGEEHGHAAARRRSRSSTCRRASPGRDRGRARCAGRPAPASAGRRRRRRRRGGAAPGGTRRSAPARRGRRGRTRARRRASRRRRGPRRRPPRRSRRRTRRDPPRGGGGGAGAGRGRCTPPGRCGSCCRRSRRS